ncbi:MAG: hypothetical protein OHK0052_20050 [Anaerolineales bacterium]
MTFDEFKQKLAESPRPVVIDLWAPWCGPCRAIAPALKKLAAEYEGRVDLWKVNVDDEPEVARGLRVMGIPTLMVFRGSKQVARMTGAQPLDGLRTLFEAGLQEAPVAAAGLGARERGFRLFLAAALLVAWAFAPSVWGWGVLAGLVLFSAVYDRCPLWRAVSGTVKRWLGQEDV